jgi:hypothetical protein
MTTVQELPLAACTCSVPGHAVHVLLHVNHKTWCAVLVIHAAAPPACSFTALPPITGGANPSWNCTKERDAAGRLPAGTACNAVCARGEYNVDLPTPTITCTANGTWSRRAALTCGECDPG